MRIGTGLVVTGLAAGIAASAAAPSQAKSAKPVTLTFWAGLTGGDHATYVALIKKFNATHPGIKVVATYLPWDSIAQKLPTAMASGSGPDIATPDYNAGTVREYQKNGLLAPLHILGSGSGEVNPAVVAPGIKSAFTIKGKMYAAPANWSTLMLYWNKTLFKAAGIAGPPTTMTQLIADAEKLTGSGKYGIALADNNTAPMWPILIWAGGGDIVNSKNCSALGSHQAASAVTPFATAIAKDGITQVGLNGQAADNLFSAQKAAMEINGPWAAGEYEPAHVKFGIAPVPVGSNGKRVTAALTVPMVASAKSKHLAQAETFFEWMLSKPVQDYLAIHANYPPARTDMAHDPGLKKNPLAGQFASQTPYARLFLPTLANFNAVDTNVFTPAIEQVERGANVASTLKAASSQLDSLVGCH
jgi:ABC-type glycerol-3-phosphate transport system substrate-binding protein